MQGKLKSQKQEMLRKSNQESNQITKECIRTALLSLLGTDTFDKITVTSIIKRAGVSKGGFYRNYKSKENVLQEICDEIFSYIWEFLSNHDFYENPRQWYIDLFQNISDHADAYQLFVNAQVPKNVVLNFDEECLLKKLQRSDSTLDRYYARAIIKSVSELVLVWFENGMKESPEEMAEILLKIFA